MKTLCTLVLLLALSPAFAQSKIEGIGPLKIGKTVLHELPVIAGTLGATFDPHKLSEEETKEMDYIVPRPMHSLLCPDAKVFFANSVTIAGVAVNNLYITFYKDTLIKIASDWSPDIEEALEIKYGKPLVKSTDKPTTCAGNEVKIVKTWRNPPVSSTSSYWKKFNSSCKEVLNSFFYIGNLTKMLYVSDVTTKNLEQLKSGSDSDKIERIRKDF